MKKLLSLLLLISFSIHSTESIKLTLPKSLKFGQSLSDTELLLNQYCKKRSKFEINPPQIPGTKNSQVQIDCHNFNFAGKERLAEFVFKDNSLYLVWVLIEESELRGLEKNLLNKFKKPTYQSPVFTAFTSQHIALRKDVPEFLFYGEEASESFENWFKSAVE